MGHIWPKESGGTPSYNPRNRSLDCQDINSNPRRSFHRATAQPVSSSYVVAGTSKVASSVSYNEAGRPYKNGSQVFSHLTDDAKTRQKIPYGGKPPMAPMGIKKSIPGQPPSNAMSRDEGAYGSQMDQDYMRQCKSI